MIPRSSPSRFARSAALAALAASALSAASAQTLPPPGGAYRAETPPAPAAPPTRSGAGPRSVIPWLEEAIQGDAGAGLRDAPALAPAAALPGGALDSPPLAAEGQPGAMQAVPGQGVPGQAGPGQAAPARSATPLGYDPLGPAPGAPGANDLPSFGGVNDPAHIEVAALENVRDAAAGTVSADELGLPVDGWRGVSEPEAAALAAKLRPTRLHSANRLAVRLLSVAFEPPAQRAAPGQPDQDLLRARIEALSRFGAVEEAAALAESAGPERAKLAAPAALVSGRDGGYCRALLNRFDDASLERIYCQAAAGDAQGATVAIAAARALGEKDETTLELLEAVAEPELASYVRAPDDMSQLTPLRLAAIRRLSLSLPQDFGRTAPLPLASAALGQGAAPRQMLEALERLEISGAVATEKLIEAYRGTQSAESGGVWGRVEAWRGALSRPPSMLDAALDHALARAEEGDRVAQMARLLAPEVAARAFDMNGAPEPSLMTATVRRLLRLGGEAEAAHRLMGPEGGYGAGPEERAIDRVAMAQAAGDWRSEDVDPLLARAVRGDQEAGRLLAALDAFGALIDDPAMAFPRDDDLAFRLQEGRAAELAFEAVGMLSAGDRMTPDALHGALNRLLALGMETEARRIAVEAVLLGS